MSDRGTTVAGLPATAALEDGRLVAVGGVAIDDLAARFGTPLWVLDRETLVTRMRAYREAFAGSEVIYAAKALCVVGVLQLAEDEGLWLDCASAGELATARAAGFPMRQVVLHGNNKSDDELAEAVRLGVGRVVVDSFDELDRLDRLAAGRGRPTEVYLRVTPGIEAHTHEYVATGHDDSKFGFTLSTGLAHEAAARAIASDSVILRGAHCHIGSQVLGLEAFAAAAEVMVGFLADLRDRHGVALAELDLGGGLGVAERAGDVPPALEAYARTLTDSVARAARARELPTPRLLVEPGRSIVAPAGITLYRVGTVKELPSLRTYVAIDGGMSDNPRFALYGAAHPFVAAGSRRLAATTRPVTVVGKHCESGDVLAEGVAVPTDLGVGDMLVATGTGAYHHSMASNYNRLPRPAMVLVDAGHAVELLARETIEDLLARDRPLRDPRTRA